MRCMYLRNVCICHYATVWIANHRILPVRLIHRYMRSNTKALWPMLIEKAWIKLLGGAGYDDICPDGEVRLA